MWVMSFCCRSSAFAQLSRAAAKSLSAQFRRLGALSIHPHWQQRASVCEQCPKRVIHRQITYCGSPFFHQIDRDPVEDGCGCPTVDKSKAPDEHCPVDPRHQPAKQILGRCTCKWCFQIDL